ncbi:MAG: hypothetical protein O2968_23200, partial [Acidobacteria bacterium]|nr:hypothetical protein [Acidobacteriota bacterium]
MDRAQRGELTRLTTGTMTLVVLACGALHAQPTGSTDLERFIPSGARIEDQARHVVLADLDADGVEEAVVFYRQAEPVPRGAGLVVLKRVGDTYEKVWGREKEISIGAVAPSGVSDLIEAGTPQIVAYWAVGASCQGVLEIFEYENGRVTPLRGDWGKEGACQNYLELKDLNSLWQNTLFSGGEKQRGGQRRA